MSRGTGGGTTTVIGSPALQAGRRTHDLSRQPDVPLLDQPLPARPEIPGIASGRYRSRRSPPGRPEQSAGASRAARSARYQIFEGMCPAGLSRTSTSAWSK